MWRPKFKSATDPRHFYFVGALVALGTLVMWLLLHFGMPLPEEASEQAKTVDALIQGHLVLIAFLFSLVVVFMLYAIVVFRKREGDEEEGAHFEGNTTLEIVWTVAPLLLVVIFAFWGIRALNTITATKANELEIDVHGMQWSWDFTYANDVKSTDLVLPLNLPILVKMHTEDVMHGFWIPEFRVKQDLVPLGEGNFTYLRFTPTKVGEYTLGCTVLCGLRHWSMVAKVKVVPESEFTVWMNSEVAKVNPALASK